jgi:cytochrome P450
VDYAAASLSTVSVVMSGRWKTTRSKLNPAFTAAKLKSLFPLAQEVCQELTEYIEKNRSTGEVTERKNNVKVIND